ncbi:MAG: hypothetical protein IPL67_10405 [Ignavibacteria bacterium]|nr:hypothetical protein [Ignavibacteria bacterium]
MKNSTTISLLKLIKPSEWKDFEKFVSSPYFNKGRNYDGLVEILGKFRFDFESDQLSKKNIYHLLFPGKQFKESVMNTMLSGLNQLCEEFILYQDFKKKPERNVRLLRQYNERGHRQKAEKVFSNLEDQIRSSAPELQDFFDRLTTLASIEDHYTIIDKRKKRYDTLMESIVNLFYFFILQSCIFRKELLTGNTYMEKDFIETTSGKLLKEIDFEKLIAIIENEEPGSSPLLRIYYMIAKAAQNIHDNKIYEELKDLITKNIKKFSVKTGKNLLLNLQLLCTSKFNAGMNEYFDELYIISKRLIDGHFYDEDESWFRPSHFRNIVRTGLSKGEVDYVERFVSEYSSRLEPELRKPLVNHCKAEISFAKKNYDDALHFLNKADIENLIFRLDAKRLTAMIYYETNSHENLNSLLDAFSHFLKNVKSKNLDIIKRNRNFVKHLKKLVKLSSAGTEPAEISFFHEQLFKDNTSAKKWLLEKTTQLADTNYGKGQKAI